MSRRIVESAIAAGDLDAGLEAHRRIVEDYNREDCESALRLRDWLERLRAEARADGHELPRPAVESGEASEAISDLDRELQRLRDGLLEGVPLDPAERSPEQQARFALAHMMEFHRREDKAGWWEYFRLLGLEERELAEERRALTGLALPGGPRSEESAAAALLHLPAQEVDARKGDEVYDAQGAKIGTVAAVNLRRAHDRHQEDARRPRTSIRRRSSFTTRCLRQRCASRSCGWARRCSRTGSRSAIRGAPPSTCCSVARRRPAMRAAACSGPTRRPCRPPAASRSHSTATCSRSRVRPARARRTPARTSSVRSCARGSRWASRRSATR